MNGQQGFGSTIGSGGAKAAQGPVSDPTGALGYPQTGATIGGILSSAGGSGNSNFQQGPMSSGLGNGTNAANPSNNTMAQQLGGGQSAYRSVNADGTPYNDPNDPSSDPSKQMTWGDWQKYQNRPQGNTWQSQMTM